MVIFVFGIEWDLETWALMCAIQNTPEQNAKDLALVVTDSNYELPDRFDVMAQALSNAIHSHVGADAAFRFRRLHDWWKTELCKGEWDTVGV